MEKHTIELGRGRWDVAGTVGECDTGHDDGENAGEIRGCSKLPSVIPPGVN